MERYDVKTEFHNIIDYPGIWVEQEYNKTTSIWEKNGARYVVPFSKDCIVDLNTGGTINQDTIEYVDAHNDHKFRWMFVMGFNKYLI